MNPSGIQPAVQEIIGKIAAAVGGGMPIYLVGGAVRDMLLGCEIHDLDFCLASGGIRTGRRVAQALNADFYPLDHKRDTGRVILQMSNTERIKIDFAAWRGETLQSDMLDRDFTINAIAMDILEPSTLIDPLGGAQDLASGVLRTCSPKSFLHDPVRILRAVRLAVQYRLKILPETKKQLEDSLNRLHESSPERVRDEVFRMFEAKKPASMLRLLEAVGAMLIVFPETGSMKGVTQPAPHTHDVWNHSIGTVQRLAEILDMLGKARDLEKGENWVYGLVSLRLGRYRNQIEDHFNSRLNPDRSLRALLMLAAFFHDIAKPIRKQVDEDGKIHFYLHDQKGAELMKVRGEALRLNGNEIERLEVIVRNHMRPNLLAQGEGKPTRRAIYRFFRDTQEAGVDICLLSLADRLATFGSTIPQEEWIRQIDVVRELLEAWWEHPHEKISPPALLNGDTLQEEFGLKPGPLIGEILEAVRESQATGEISTYEQALAFVRNHLDQG